MAKASFITISALRNTAARISKSQNYQWGHMGLCNCGFLAQEITKLRKDEIHNRAMAGHGDWTEQLRDYCPSSGVPMDEVISRMLNAGFDTEDLRHLERLTDPATLNSLPPGSRHLRYNIKEDVVTYLMAWSRLLEEQLLRSIAMADLPTLSGTTVAETECNP